MGFVSFFDFLLARDAYEREAGRCCTLPDCKTSKDAPLENGEATKLGKLLSERVLRQTGSSIVGG